MVYLIWQQQLDYRHKVHTSGSKWRMVASCQQFINYCSGSHKDPCWDHSCTFCTQQSLVRSRTPWNEATPVCQRHPGIREHHCRRHHSSRLDIHCMYCRYARLDVCQQAAFESSEDAGHVAGLQSTRQPDWQQRHSGAVNTRSASRISFSSRSGSRPWQPTFTVGTCNGTISLLLLSSPATSPSCSLIVNWNCQNVSPGVHLLSPGLL